MKSLKECLLMLSLCIVASFSIVEMAQARHYYSYDYDEPEYYYGDEYYDDGDYYYYDDRGSRAAKGAVGGALVGATVGGLAGGGRGAGIGAGVGAGLGLLGGL